MQSTDRLFVDAKINFGAMLNLLEYAYSKGEPSDTCKRTKRNAVLASFVDICRYY